MKHAHATNFNGMRCSTSCPDSAQLYINLQQPPVPHSLAPTCRNPQPRRHSLASTFNHSQQGTVPTDVQQQLKHGHRKQLTSQPHTKQQLTHNCHGGMQQSAHGLPSERLAHLPRGSNAGLNNSRGASQATSIPNVLLTDCQPPGLAVCSHRTAHNCSQTATLCPCCKPTFWSQCIMQTTLSG